MRLVGLVAQFIGFGERGAGQVVFAEIGIDSAQIGEGDGEVGVDLDGAFEENDGVLPFACET